MQNETNDVYQYHRKLKDDTKISADTPPPKYDVKLYGKGYGKTYYAPQPIVYENEYWNPTTMRTYRELYKYYKASDYYNAKGYKSSTYLMTYYDGYGYNFYYTNYGYYEFARSPAKVSGEKWSFLEFIKVFLGLTALLAIYGWVYYCLETKGS